MNKEIPDKDYAYNALLRYNYLPMVNKHLDYIPSQIFSTEDFTPALADEMLHNTAPRKKGGYDQIEFRSTRFPNMTRLFHIPHPVPYARLCQCISENWNKPKIIRICENPNSNFKPAKHDDGRLIMGEYKHLGRISIMDSDDFRELILKIDASTGKFYRVKADISTFFPSIYTHSIPWALVGRDQAKRDARNTASWYNKLDTLQRRLKRNETQGVPIGPATSHIISEIILCEVDEALCAIDDTYQFTHFADDYECYCETRAQAETFILDLERELRKYLLELNPKKLLIEELPVGYQEQWIRTLRHHLPSNQNQNQKLSPRCIIEILDSAVDLQKHYPDKNVLKYAARAIANSKANSDILDKESANYFLKYLNNLAVHNPSVLPILCQVAKEHDVGKENDVGSDLEIMPVLQQSIKFQRSDAICWSLYFMGISGQKVSNDLAKKIIETGDCMSIGMLIALGQHEQEVLDFLDDIKMTSCYDWDQYWILIYELAPSGGNFDGYLEKSGFKFLRDKNVRFINPIETET